MSNSSSNSTSTGISTSGLLGVLFVGLKLTGYINWPWLWVLSPFWIPVVILIGILLVLLVIWLIASFLEK